VVDVNHDLTIVKFQIQLPRKSHRFAKYYGEYVIAQTYVNCETITYSELRPYSLID
jgi:hypothetical protein